MQMQQAHTQERTQSPPHPPENVEQAHPSQGDISEHALSNDLRELGEEELKSAVVTDNPQQTVENASRIERDSNNNTVLANSELIQLPVQQFLQQQQQTQLRLSTPVPTNRQPNYIQAPYANNQQSNPNVLRASLPVNSPSPAINTLNIQVPIQQSIQPFPGWINQPATTQARIQTNVREFPPQPQPNQLQPRVPANMQQNNNQSRPTSTSPQRITFNYHPSQKNIPNPPPPLPQPQPAIVQPVPRPQPQPQPQPPQVIVHPPPLPQPVPPRPIDNSAHFILPNPNQPNQEVLIWQQRYFIILQKFQYYYTRIEIIHKKCIYLDQAIIQTKKTQELELLKAESQELLTLITATEQELIETIHRNRELISEATNWKQKYEQLAKQYAALADAYEALRQSQAATNQELVSKGQFWNKQLAEMQGNYRQVAKKNEQEIAKNQQLTAEVISLNETIKRITQQQPHQPNSQQNYVQYKEMTRIIQQKNQIIINLKKALQQQHQANIPTGAADVLEKEIRRLQGQLNSTHQTISALTEENNKITHHAVSVKSYDEKIQKLQQQIAKRDSIIANNEADIKRYIALVQAKTAEINNFSRQSVSSQGSPRSSDYQIQNRRLKHELTVYEESHSSQLKMFNGKIQELLDKIKMISSQRDSTVTTLHEKATLLESDLNRKDGTIRNLRDRILELEEEKRIRDLDRKYEPKQKAEDNSQNDQEVNSLKRKLNDKINEIEELQAQLTEYKRITNEYQDSLRVKKHEINSLKRDLEQKSEGVQDSSHLNEQLAKKNAELTQLRNKLVEQEKIANQNQVLRQQNSHLNESLRKKHAELTQAVDKAYILEKKLRELQAMSESSPKLLHLVQEVELLQSANNKKDQQIAKLRQSSQLLQSNIDELEVEVGRLKGRLNQGEKSSESERGELKSKLSVLQLKVVEYERKSAGLEEVRAIMTEQINTLTAEIHIKYENQQRLELELKQERARSKAFESEIQSQLMETEEARAKLREWEKKCLNLSKELENELQRKKDLTNTKKNEVYNLNNKYVELQNTLKAKQAKIKELQKTIESLSSKIRTFDHNMEEIEYLKHKISEYQYKISYQTHKFSTRLPDLQPTQVFERKVIYQLKVENEALRRQLGLAPKPQGKEANIPEKDTNNNSHVNQRLNDFNKKLEQVLSQNLVIDYNLTGDQLYRRMERDRRLLIEKHNEQIAQLKVKILQLSGNTGSSLPKKYTNINQIFNEQLDFYREKNLELEQRVENHIKVNRQLKESIELLLKAHSGDSSLTYYKEQLEKANDTIVNLQRQIKKSNEELKKLKEDASAYNARSLAGSNVAESESKVIDLTRKISQLTLQVNLLEKERVLREESISKYQSQIKRLKIASDEVRVQRDDLQRVLKEKEGAYQDELAKITNKLRINQMEIERLNEVANKRQDMDSSQLKNIKTRSAQLQEQNKKLRAKVEELIINQEKYQRQIAKLQNKIQILLGQSQRLKEVADGVGKKHRQGDVQLQTLRVTINEYEVKIKTFESQRESFTYKENQYQQEISRIQNQTRLLQSQIERINQFTQKKVSEKDTEIGRLKTLLNEKLDQNSRFEDQIREMKVLSFKTNETAQQIFALKEEINALKTTLALKVTESDNRLREIYELNDRLRFNEEQAIQVKRGWQAKIVELQGALNSLQGQLSDVRKSRDSTSSESSQRVQVLEEQLRALRLQKDQEIATFKSRISIFESQIYELRSSYELQITQLKVEGASQQQVDELTLLNGSLSEQLRLVHIQNQQLRVELHVHLQTINELQIHITHLQEQINSHSHSHSNASNEILNASRYSLEYLRSILIEIEVLLSEEGTIRFDILQRVEKEVESGLEQCRKWNETFAL